MVSCDTVEGGDKHWQCLNDVCMVTVPESIPYAQPRESTAGISWRKRKKKNTAYTAYNACKTKE